MSDDWERAIVYVHSSDLVRRTPGWQSDGVVGCKVDGVEKAWPRTILDGRAEFELEGKDLVPLYHVDVDLAESVIPHHVARDYFTQWIRDVKRDSLRADGSYDEVIIQERLTAFGDGRERAALLKRMFQGEMRPEDTARIFHRRFLEVFMRRAEAAWPLVIAGVLFGLLEGWQLADTVLPDAGKSVWFGPIMAAVILGGVVWMSIKEGGR